MGRTRNEIRAFRNRASSTERAPSAAGGVQKSFADIAADMNALAKERAETAARQAAEAAERAKLENRILVYRDGSESREVPLSSVQSEIEDWMACPMDALRPGLRRGLIFTMTDEQCTERGVFSQSQSLGTRLSSDPAVSVRYVDEPRLSRQTLDTHIVDTLFAEGTYNCYSTASDKVWHPAVEDIKAMSDGTSGVYASEETEKETPRRILAVRLRELQPVNYGSWMDMRSDMLADIPLQVDQPSSFETIHEEPNENGPITPTTSPSQPQPRRAIYTWLGENGSFIQNWLTDSLRSFSPDIRLMTRGKGAHARSILIRRHEIPSAYKKSLYDSLGGVWTPQADVYGFQSDSGGLLKVETWTYPDTDQNLGKKTGQLIPTPSLMTIEDAYKAEEEMLSLVTHAAGQPFAMRISTRV